VASIGFSTGALAKGDFATAIKQLREWRLTTIELSALRLRELSALTYLAENCELSDFDYVSIHAPTDFEEREEVEVAAIVTRIAKLRQWPVVLHPDCIHDFECWQPLGSMLLIENMDRRKHTGRTVEELELVLQRLPMAWLCFDIAHARQVDSSMTEAYRILKRFANRIRQWHVSEVSSSSRHDAISQSAFWAYQEVASILPIDIPAILETPSSSAEPLSQVQLVTRLIELGRSAQVRIA
jgi:hypothetical protein